MCRWIVPLVLAWVMSAGCGSADKKKVDGGAADPVDLTAESTGYDCGLCPDLLDLKDRAEPPQDLADEPPPPDLADEPPSPEDTVDVPEPPPDVADTAEIPEPPPDIKPDYQGMSVAAFRITSMTIQEPKFCVGGPDDCQEINAFIDAGIQTGIDSLETSVIGTFTPFNPGDLSTLTLGAADCASAGAQLECTFKDGTYPATYENVLVSVDDYCMIDEVISALHPPPCFGTEEADLALELYGVVLGLSNVNASGQFVDWPPQGKIDNGAIVGYLPEEIAKTVAVMVPVDFMPVEMTLYDLLVNSPSQPVEVDGHAAWMVMMDFMASEVLLTE